MTRKSLELADHALWDVVKRGIRPLAPAGGTARLSKKPGRLPVDSKAVAARSPVRIADQPKGNSKPPPLAQLDRRTAQRLGRGQIEPEARLDLHGEGLETARMKLLHFLTRERLHGMRFVLVITGKGASPFARHTLHGTSHFHAPEREGRLRREVPLWLEEESFRLHAVGFQPAHPRHGGGGAFYVRLRKSGHHP